MLKREAVDRATLAELGEHPYITRRAVTTADLEPKGAGEGECKLFAYMKKGALEELQGKAKVTPEQRRLPS